MWYLTDNMGEFYPSTALDLLARRPIEAEYLFRKPVKRGAQLGVVTPALDELLAQIETVKELNGV